MMPEFSRLFTNLTECSRSVLLVINIVHDARLCGMSDCDQNVRLASVALESTDRSCTVCCIAVESGNKYWSPSQPST